MERAGGRKRRYPVAKIKGGWTAEEDEALKQLVELHGQGAWSAIARALNALMCKPEHAGRIGKQCRERWNHHLQPGIRTGAWDDEEEAHLVAAHRQYGNKWSDIARAMVGRSENAIKNHWNATLRRKDAKACGPPSPLKAYMQEIGLLPGGLPFSMHHQAWCGGWDSGFTVAAAAAAGGLQMSPAVTAETGAVMAGVCALGAELLRQASAGSDEEGEEESSGAQEQGEGSGQDSGGLEDSAHEDSREHPLRAAKRRAIAAAAAATAGELAGDKGTGPAKQAQSDCTADSHHSHNLLAVGHDNIATSIWQASHAAAAAAPLPSGAQSVFAASSMDQPGVLCQPGLLSLPGSGAAGGVQMVMGLPISLPTRSLACHQQLLQGTGRSCSASPEHSATTATHTPWLLMPGAALLQQHGMAHSQMHGFYAGPAVGGAGGDGRLRDEVAAAEIMLALKG